MFRSYLFFCLLLFFTATQQARADNRQQYVKSAGDALAILLPAAALGQSLYEKDLEGGLQYSAALTTSLATTFTLKYTIDAERPNGTNNRSFPSGHSSTAFVSAGYLQMRYGWTYGVPAYALATFVAWSRVYTEYHYTRDVIAGGIIGIVSSYIFTDAYKKKVSISPIAENGIYGLSFSSRFSTY